jgi:hypothetical protein
MIPWAILIVAAFSLAISLLVETSSWWVRAQAPYGATGLYVSRSNIYLYGGRFFSLAFTSLIAFWIESGGTPIGVSLLLAGSLGFSAVFQILLLHNLRSISIVMRIVGWCLRLPKPEIRPPDRSRPAKWALLTATAASSLIFGIGLGAPLLAAVLVPEYRLSISYLGQIINSLGTLFVLLLVDQVLFASLDAGTLREDVLDYGRGRAIGFLLAGLVFLGTAMVIE